MESKNSKLAILITLLFSIMLSAKEYSPLTQKDKKVFRNTYRAVELAYKQGKYKEVAMFIPTIKEKYVSLLIDPNSMELVDLYKRLDIIMSNCSSNMRYDSLLDEIDESTGYEQILKYQKLMKYLNKRGNDSIMRLHYERIKKLVRREFNAVPTLKSYSNLIKMAYTDVDFLFTKRKQLEDQINVEFLRLTSGMEVDSILKFRYKYPDVRSSDIKNILEKAQMKWRASILLHPSIKEYIEYAEKFPDDASRISDQMKKGLRRKIIKTADVELIEQYYKAFPGKDTDLECALEDRIYKKYMATLDYRTGLFYLERFPNGLYINNVRKYMHNDTF